MARAIWKAVLRIGDERVPVKLYSGAQEQTVHFHLLHDQDLAQVRQRLVNPATGEEVPYAEVRRGHEVEPGRFVILREEELAELEPPASRDVVIECFLPPSAIDHRVYERPYYLGPDGDEEAYWALVAALGRRGLEGIARWVMRKRRYTGALRVERGALMLMSLRGAGEVIPTSELEPPQGRAIEAREREMAEQLVHALADAFEPEAYHDEHREALLALIDSKREGREFPFEELEDRRESEESLSDALAASLAAVAR